MRGSATRERTRHGKRTRRRISEIEVAHHRRGNTWRRSAVLENHIEARYWPAVIGSNHARQQLSAAYVPRRLLICSADASNKAIQRGPGLPPPYDDVLWGWLPERGE